MIVDGWLAEAPRDFPRTEKKDRLVRLDLSLKPRKKGAEWITVSLYKKVAALAVEGLRLQRGDLVRVEGFLASWIGNGRCGRRHRYTTVVGRHVELLEGSNDRPEKHYDDVSVPPALQDEDHGPFGRPVEEDPV